MSPNNQIDAQDLDHLAYIQHMIWAKNNYHERMRISEILFSIVSFLLRNNVTNQSKKVTNQVKKKELDKKRIPAK